jgi:hypothetical protein
MGKQKGVQRAMHCSCGRARILAHGLCATCYTLKRQDAEYFGGHGVWQRFCTNGPFGYLERSDTPPAAFELRSG